MFKLNFIQVTDLVTWIVTAAQRQTDTNGLNHRKHWILGPKDTLTLVGGVEIISSRSSHSTDEKSKAQRAVFRKAVVPCRFSEGNLNRWFPHIIQIFPVSSIHPYLWCQKTCFHGEEQSAAIGCVLPFPVARRIFNLSRCYSLCLQQSSPKPGWQEP